MKDLLQGAALVLLALGVQGVVAQQAATAPVAEPTLADTMKFIQDKLKEFGSTEYVMVPGPYQTSLKYTVSDVSANPSTCTIQVNSVTSQQVFQGNWTQSASTQTVFLKDVVSVSTGRIVDTSGALVPTEPAVFAVSLKVPKNTVSVHYAIRKSSDGKKYKKPETGDSQWPSAGYEFLDEEMANRVENALKHAVALCAPPPPAARDTHKKDNEPY